MFVPMPFPRCPQCGEMSSKGYHKDCGGVLEINPETERVFCPKCSHMWDLYDSEYYCSCGEVYEADEITEAISEMLMICKICMDEIAEQQKAINRREHLVESSIRGFVNGLFEKIGFAIGVAAETVIRAVIRLLF